MFLYERLDFDRGRASPTPFKVVVLCAKGGGQEGWEAALIQSAGPAGQDVQDV